MKKILTIAGLLSICLTMATTANATEATLIEKDSINQGIPVTVKVKVGKEDVGTFFRYRAFRWINGKEETPQTLRAPTPALTSEQIDSFTMDSKNLDCGNFITFEGVSLFVGNKVSISFEQNGTELASKQLNPRNLAQFDHVIFRVVCD